ncbi:MAG TPA: DUF2252 family protein [Microlunatus sp.]
MMASAFTFYRGSAAIMAADLAGTPSAGLDVQLCVTRICPPSASSPRRSENSVRVGHLPRLGRRRRDRSLLLLAPAAGHEGIGRRRVHGSHGSGILCPDLRLDPGAGARPIGRPGGDRGLPGREPHVRQSDRRVRRAVCRPERPRLTGVPRRHRSGRIEARSGV